MGLAEPGFFPRRGVSWRRVQFSFCLIFGIPEGDFVFAAEFNAAVAETSTSNAAFIVAGMSKKLAFASQALMKKAKADDDLRVKRANESLSLAERLKRAEEDIQTLTKLSSSLKDENKLAAKGKVYKIGGGRSRQ